MILQKYLKFLKMRDKLIKEKKSMLMTFSSFKINIKVYYNLQDKYLQLQLIVFNI